MSRNYSKPGTLLKADGLVTRYRFGAFYPRAAEASLPVIEHDELTGRNASLRLVEDDVDAAVVDQRDPARLIRLPVARFGCATQRLPIRKPGRRRADPMQAARNEAIAQQRGMIAALDHPKNVSPGIFLGHVPGRACSRPLTPPISRPCLCPSV